MDTAEVPPLSPNEPLGRYVLSESRARKALRRGEIEYDIFLERIDKDRISVDRLDLASDTEMAEIADEVADARAKRFFGWAVVSVSYASEMGRWVEATPLLNNRFHADVCLKLPRDADRRDAAREHAINLAKGAKYRPRPMSPPPWNSL